MKFEHRSAHLDGLRGIAAVAVALLHFFRSFDNSQLSSAKVLNYTPLSAFWNGHFAVAIFFVMSGFLFFRKFHGAGVVPCVRGAVKRYFRLSIPILALSLVAFALHLGGLMPNAEAAATSGSDWLAKWYRFPPDILLAIGEPLYSAYVHFDATYSYNTNLWTILLRAVCGVRGDRPCLAVRTVEPCAAGRAAGGGGTAHLRHPLF